MAFSRSKRRRNHLISLVGIFLIVITSWVSAQEPGNKKKNKPKSASEQLTITQIQGEGPISPHVDKKVRVSGVVTYIDDKNIYIQQTSAPKGKGSSGLQLYCKNGTKDLKLAPTQTITVEGVVSEYEAKDSDYPVTQIIIERPGQIVEETEPAGQKALPKPVALNLPGLAYVHTTKALPLYEKYESMLVKVASPVLVENHYDKGIIYAGEASGINSLNALTITQSDNGTFDFNAERINLRLSKENKGALRGSRTGSKLEDIIGVIDLSRGFPQLKHTNLVELKPAKTQPKQPETDLTIDLTSERLRVASYNVENLYADECRITEFAKQIAHDLAAPDLLALIEIQDDGGTEGGVEDPSVSTEKVAAGFEKSLKSLGKKYRYFDLPPVAHQEGGAPGGNIRVAFLYNPDRLELVEEGGKPHLFRIPGDERPKQEHEAFKESRKSLCAEFRFKPTGSQFYAIANHWTSKRGDKSVWLKKLEFGSEVQRERQATVIADAVKRLRKSAPDKPVIVLGDLNDIPGSKSLQALTNDWLMANLVESLPQVERISYRYDGNLSCFDHILVTPDLADKAEIQILPLNSLYFKGEAPYRKSDHDPVIASLVLPGCEVPAPAPKATKPGHPNQNATLWMQEAQEYKAIATQTYLAAASQLEKTMDQKVQGALVDFAPAVILDIDETVLDNSPFQGQLVLDQVEYTSTLWNQWVVKAEAKPIPGAVDYIHAARSAGVTVFYVTNREDTDSEGKSTRDTTLQNLKTVLGYDVHPDHLLMKYDRYHPWKGSETWSSEKQSRRQAIASRYQVLQLIGDDLGDFLPNVKATVTPTIQLRREKFQEHADHFGRDWFVLPNPTYGSWLRIRSETGNTTVTGFNTKDN